MRFISFDILETVSIGLTGAVTAIIIASLNIEISKFHRLHSMDLKLDTIFYFIINNLYIKSYFNGKGKLIFFPVFTSHILKLQFPMKKTDANQFLNLTEPEIFPPPWVVYSCYQHQVCSDWGPGVTTCTLHTDN